VVPERVSKTHSVVAEPFAAIVPNDHSPSVLLRPAIGVTELRPAADVGLIDTISKYTLRRGPME
jgi:hypothetical protein